MLGPIALVAGLLILAAVVYTSRQPDTFTFSRTQFIDAPAGRIFPHIDDLRAFNVWNPFLKNDPACQVSYSGPPQGPGSKHAWKGNSNVGEGNVEIVSETPPSLIEMKLTMLKPMAAENKVVFTLAPNGSGTDVTWTMSGRSSLMSKIMCLVVNTDTMVGGAFARGLADLKVLVETA